MTAIRVVDDHDELENSGTVSHGQLDNFINNTTWLVVSGSPSPVPPSARRLVAGSGVVITDNGPGGDLVISATLSGSVQATISWMEVPVGTRDGVNKDFTLLHNPFQGNTLMFYVNGILQAPGPDSDYLLVSGNMIHVNYQYRSGSNFFATYPY